MNRTRGFLPVFISLILCAGILVPAAAGDWEHVDSLEMEDQVIRAVWAAFVERLKEGDVEGAVQYHVPRNRESVAKVYKVLGDSLKGLPDTWTDLMDPVMNGPYVSYTVIDESTKMISGVTFLKFPNGQWLIENM